MLPSHYAHKLPEVGDTINNRVLKIRELERKRAEYLEAASLVLGQICEAEQELANTIKTLWTTKERKEAEKLTKPADRQLATVNAA